MSVEEPFEHRVRVNGVELAYFERGAAYRGAGPTLVFAHATGFHARVWDPVVERLGARHVIAIDQRGHGRSEKREITHWKVFGEDLAELVRTLDLRDVVGVGHSMGGHAMVDAAASLQDRFRRIVIIDPVIPAPDQYGGGGWTIQKVGGEPHPTVKRKRHFDSPEAMIARFEDREPYSVFHQDALRAYCTYGLLPSASGDGYDLACPPEVEASVYMTSRTHPAVYDSVRSLDRPVLILRAKLPPAERSMMDFSSSPTWPGLVKEFAQGREVFFPDHTHFLPMEIPDEVARLIRAELEA
jgi:pimeloyl-ACP methyl ester carboxylesterase